MHPVFLPVYQAVTAPQHPGNSWLGEPVTLTGRETSAPEISKATMAGSPLMILGSERGRQDRRSDSAVLLQSRLPRPVWLSWGQTPALGWPGQVTSSFTSIKRHTSANVQVLKPLPGPCPVSPEAPPLPASPSLQRPRPLRITASLFHLAPPRRSAQARPVLASRRRSAGRQTAAASSVLACRPWSASRLLPSLPARWRSR